MSGLNKQPPRQTGQAPVAGLIDPTVELTQPGGPFPYGETLLTDGFGGYTIGATLRPYTISFRIPRSVEPAGTVPCEHQGVSSDLVGVPIPRSANLVSIVAVVDHPVPPPFRYAIDVIVLDGGSPRVVASVEIGAAKRRWLVDGFSVEIDSRFEVGVQLRHLAGDGVSPFTTGLVVLEMES